MSADLVTWLREQIADDEQAAQRMHDAVWPEVVYVVPSNDTGPPRAGEPAGSVSVGPQYSKAYARVWNPTQFARERGVTVEQGNALHDSAIEVWGPSVAARVLEEVAAKRAILEHEDMWGEDSRVLLILAQVYRDRPGFDPPWLD